MKKLSVIIMALALVMGFTQCKKEQNVANNTGSPELIGEKYDVALTLGGGSNSKASVHPFEGAELNYAPVYYDEGDVIQVVYKGINVGHMTCTASDVPTDPHNYNEASASFSGTITVADDAIDGQSPLYFYFLGNKDGGNVSGEFTVDLSDQTGSLPVISYAPSKEPFTAANQNYTIYNGNNISGGNWLLNQCALVRFKCENIYHNGPNATTITNSIDNNDDAIYTTGRAITIYGMDNQVTIDLTNPGGNNQFTWGTKENSEGAMKLWMPASDTTVRYAIVKPMTYSKTNADLDVAFTPKTATVGGQTVKADPYGFFGTYNLNAEIANNAYYPDGEIDLVWHSGAFSISATEQVVFSRGNLQYAARGAADPNGTWRFAKHQYDFVGGLCEGTTDTYLGNVVNNENSNTDNTMSDNTRVLNISNYSGWIDLFGWGTGNVPTVIRKDNLFYTHDGSSYYHAALVQDVSANNRFHEWGANYIVNAGTSPEKTTWWETLSKDEAVYLFETRSNATSKIGFGRIKVSNGLTDAVNGLIILPDEFTLPATCSWNSVQEHHALIGYSGIGYDNNEYSVAKWAAMEAAGAVFLPAAGERDADGGNDLAPTKIEFDSGSGTHSENQDRGNYYWNDLQGPSAAWGLGFGYASGNDLGNKVNANCGLAPNNGRSVRLVHRLNSSSKLGRIFGK